MGASAINAIGSDLPTLFGIFSCCRGVVSNDSGAVHVAAALGVPVTALFGPTNEKATSPLGGRTDGGRPDVVVLTSDAWCRPCMLRECPIDHRCMTGIRPEAALAAVRRSL